MGKNTITIVITFFIILSLLLILTHILFYSSESVIDRPIFKLSPEQSRPLSVYIGSLYESIYHSDDVKPDYSAHKRIRDIKQILDPVISSPDIIPDEDYTYEEDITETADTILSLRKSPPKDKPASSPNPFSISPSREKPKPTYDLKDENLVKISKRDTQQQNDDDDDDDSVTIIALMGVVIAPAAVIILIIAGVIVSSCYHDVIFPNRDSPIETDLFDVTTKKSSSSIDDIETGNIVPSIASCGILSNCSSSSTTLKSRKKSKKLKRISQKKAKRKKVSFMIHGTPNPSIRSKLDKPPRSRKHKCKNRSRISEVDQLLGNLSQPNQYK